MSQCNCLDPDAGLCDSCEKDAKIEQLTRERDEALASMFVALQERDAANSSAWPWRALVRQRCDGIECDHAKERDALKAALRDIVAIGERCDCDGHCVCGDRAEDCAREALGEVES